MKPNGYDNCEQVQSYYALYSIPVAAMLWCQVPPDQINDHLSKSTQTNVRGVLFNPYIPCLEPKCRALQIAIDNGELPVCREKGVPVDDHVAPERRHVRREDLKVWIAKTFPADKPSFLFDETEKKAHPSISIESYTALQADRDAIKVENEKLKSDNRAKSEVIADMEMQIKSMDAYISRMTSNQLTEKEPTNQNKSEVLTAVNQASMKFWNNADKNDQDTWTTNQVVIDWLMKEHKFSENIAKAAATIVRPEWAKK